MKKSPDAFRTISEVAAWLDTPAHVLRFWESRFPDLKPVQRAGGRRYYRRDDMLLLGGIKHLLHTEGHTIKSVQDRITADGTSAVAAFSPTLGSTPANDATDALIALELETTAQQRAEGMAPGSQPDDTAPPVGFFFDDSDDAAPAEAQSGTFAQPVVPDLSNDSAPPTTTTPEPSVPIDVDPSGMAVPDSAAPVLEPRLGPIPHVPDDPADTATGLTAPLPFSARLRALDRDDVPVVHRVVLKGLFRRLEGWFHATGRPAS